MYRPIVTQEESEEIEPGNRFDLYMGAVVYISLIVAVILVC